MLESQGDGAMRSKNYDSAIAQYSAALTVTPAALQVATLFVKRSEALAELCLWEDALKDADEVRVLTAVVVLLPNSASRVD
jgi:tetratricopeptide (TPR) repeat protein